MSRRASSKKRPASSSAASQSVQGRAYPKLKLSPAKDAFHSTQTTLMAYATPIGGPVQQQQKQASPPQPTTKRPRFDEEVKSPSAAALKLTFTTTPTAAAALPALSRQRQAAAAANAAHHLAATSTAAEPAAAAPSDSSAMPLAATPAAAGAESAADCLMATSAADTTMSDRTNWNPSSLTDDPDLLEDTDWPEEEILLQTITTAHHHQQHHRIPRAKPPPNRMTLQLTMMTATPGNPMHLQQLQSTTADDPPGECKDHAAPLDGAQPMDIDVAALTEAAVSAVAGTSTPTDAITPILISPSPNPQAMASSDDRSPSSPPPPPPLPAHADLRTVPSLLQHPLQKVLSIVQEGEEQEEAGGGGGGEGPTTPVAPPPANLRASSGALAMPPSMREESGRSVPDGQQLQQQRSSSISPHQQQQQQPPPQQSTPNLQPTSAANSQSLHGSSSFSQAQPPSSQVSLANLLPDLGDFSLEYFYQDYPDPSDEFVRAHETTASQEEEEARFQQMVQDAPEVDLPDVSDSAAAAPSGQSAGAGSRGARMAAMARRATGSVRPPPPAAVYTQGQIDEPTQVLAYQSGGLSPTQQPPTSSLVSCSSNAGTQVLVQAPSLSALSAPSVPPAARLVCIEPNPGPTSTCRRCQDEYKYEDGPRDLAYDVTQLCEECGPEVAAHLEAETAVSQELGNDSSSHDFTDTPPPEPAPPPKKKKKQICRECKNKTIHSSPAGLCIICSQLLLERHQKELPMSPLKYRRMMSTDPHRFAMRSAFTESNRMLPPWWPSPIFHFQEPTDSASIMVVFPVPGFAEHDDFKVTYDPATARLSIRFLRVKRVCNGRKKRVQSYNMGSEHLFGSISHIWSQLHVIDQRHIPSYVIAEWNGSDGRPRVCRALYIWMRKSRVLEWPQPFLDAGHTETSAPENSSSRSTTQCAIFNMAQDRTMQAGDATENSRRAVPRARARLLGPIFSHAPITAELIIDSEEELSQMIEALQPHDLKVVVFVIHKGESKDSSLSSKESHGVRYSQELIHRTIRQLSEMKGRERHLHVVLAMCYGADLLHGWDIPANISLSGFTGGLSVECEPMHVARTLLEYECGDFAIRQRTTLFHQRPDAPYAYLGLIFNRSQASPTRARFQWHMATGHVGPSLTPGQSTHTWRPAKQAGPTGSRVCVALTPGPTGWELPEAPAHVRVAPTRGGGNTPFDPTADWQANALHNIEQARLDVGY